MALRFRPHHFLCTLGFEGKGYSPEFVTGYQAIVDRLKKSPVGDEVEIEVVSETDSICDPCPNRSGTLCSSEPKIRALDAAHAKILGLRAGDRITWAEAKARVTRHFTDEAFAAACSPCSWKGLGYCQAALTQVREENKP